MLNKYKWHSLLLIGFTLILATLVTACTPVAETVTTTSTSTTTQMVTMTTTVTATIETTATVTTTVTPTTMPKGSVLEFNGSFTDSYTEQEGGRYWGYIITARVQNVGDDGVITFMAEIDQWEYVFGGRNTKYIEVYLRQGEEKQLSFNFEVLYPNEGFQFSVRSVD